jgi:hypothetical protein
MQQMPLDEALVDALLEDELLELEEELLEELVEPVVELDELLLEEELVEPVVELEELDELLLEVPPSPVQVGAIKLPSCVPWKPKTLVAVWPGAGNCQLCWLVNCQVVPGALSDGVRVTFHWPTGVTVSGKFSVIVQLLNAVVPVLVTLMSTWKKLPPVLDGVAVQLCAANAWLPSIRLDSSMPSLMNVFIRNPSGKFDATACRPCRDRTPGYKELLGSLIAIRQKITWPGFEF